MLHQAQLRKNIMVYCMMNHELSQIYYYAVLTRENGW